MAHSTPLTPVDFTPTTPARRFSSLHEQVEAIIAVLPEVVPDALKATVPSARDGAAEAIIADLIPRLRTYGAQHSYAAQA